MSRTWKRFLSLLLVATLVLSLGATGFAAEEPAEEAGSNGVAVDFEQVDNDIISERLPLAHQVNEEAQPEYTDDELVRVSIVLEGQSALDAGYAPAAAGGYRASLKAEQQAMAQKISKQALNGAKLDVVWNITLAGNIISANVPYGQIGEIKTVLGVKDVVIENRYAPDEGEVSPNNGNATVMTGAVDAWDLGYTGAGSVVAIIDTGLDTDHQSFDAAAFQYAIDELNQTRETPVKLMTASDVAAKWDQLNIAARLGSADGIYRDVKVPFGANYVDSDLDITHDNDGQGEHGSHVAGIAAANKYIPGENGFEKAMDTVLTQGQAPDAQLMIMKVFGKGGGAYDSDYMVAIEDAVTLGADAVNLSLGSSSAGLTTNSTYAAILNKLVDNGTVAVMSAGNNYYWSEASLGQYGIPLYEDDINYHTGGSPGTYNNSLGVASVDNTGTTGFPLMLGDEAIFFNESTGEYGNLPIATIAGEYSYILVTTPGNEEADFAALAEVLEGKIGVCSRGSTSFYQKANASIANGGIATIIYNNQPGTINMNLTGYEFTAPAVSITQADGALMRAAGEEKTLNGVTYYEGTISITDKVCSVNTTPEYLTMSDFSSWGGNGGLTMKPEITAPGGNIWSVNGAIPGGTEYEIMSGTSMAAPQVAGLTAVVKQYIRETGLQAKLGLTERAIAQSLLMSTATALRDANANGGFYSVLKQGAGLANVNNVINARSFVQVVSVPETAPASAAASIADGKVKIEVGQVNGGFNAAFNLTNFSDEDMSFYLSGEMFTQDVSSGFRWLETVPVPTAFSWSLNGEPFAAPDLALDFNGDGVANGVDAQTLLNWCADNDYAIVNLDKADLDEDGDVDTADAKIAFEKLNGVTANLAAGETVTVGVAASFDMSQYDAVNGNYVEGFLFIREGETNDGALGVEHSIPVYGFNGNFSDATMFDRGSYLEYLYEFGDGETVYPYMYYADLGDPALEAESFLVSYVGDKGEYYFGGNPLMTDESYHPERNAINSNDVITGVQYSQIRNSAGSRFFVSDQAGNIIRSSLMENNSPAYAAYYYRNQAVWRNMTASASLGWQPDQAEGTKLMLNYQLAPEYYVIDQETGAIDWDALGIGSLMSIPFIIDNTAPDIVEVFSDSDEAPSTLTVRAHDNQFIAAVGLFTEQGELVGVNGAVEDILRGKEFDYEFDISENENPHLLVQVYDYAMNLSTFKVNFNTDELDDEVSVVLSADNLRVMRGQTDKLSATVYPWGVDDSVTWSSSDESIVTVDTNGIVTGVGVGTALVTATSVLDPEASASAEVEVFTIALTALGTLQDAVGQPTLYTFDFEHDATWTAEGTYNVDMTAAAWDFYTDDGAYFYQQDWEGYMHKMSLYTLEEVEKSAATTGFGIPVEDVDFPYIYNLTNDSHRMFGVSEGYYLFSEDPMDNSFNRGYNLGSYLGYYTGASYFVAIAWGGQSQGGDIMFALDNAGYIWFLNTATLGLNFFESDLSLKYSLLQDTYGNSMVMGDDGELYLSHFNGSTSELYQLAYDVNTDSFVSTKIGDVGADVWPATLLAVAENEGADETEITSAFSDRMSMACPVDASLAVAYLSESDVVDVAYIDGQIVELGEDGAIEADGGLNSVRVAKPGDASTEEVKTEVVVTVEADELTYNGLITVEYDPMNAELVDCTVMPQFKAVVNEPELGKLVLAYVDLDGIEMGDPILVLKFAYGSSGTVTITTEQVNNNTDLLPLTEYVILGKGEIDADHEHTYGEPGWLWTETEDGFDATATFLCTEDGASKTVKAEVTSEVVGASCVEDGEKTYTATVEFEGNTYTDTKTVPVEALGHQAGEPVKENEVPADCENAGSYDLVTYCTECGAEIARETVDLPALGHDFGEPVWAWTETEDGFTATVTFTCSRGDKVETIDADVTVEITEPSCEEAGSKVFTATAEFEDETYTDTKTVEIPATNHAYGEPTWTWAEDLRSATATFVCANNAEHVQELEAEVVGSGDVTGMTFTATVEFEGKTYTDTKEAAVAGQVFGSSMTLGEKFSSNVYIEFNSEILADKEAYVTVNGVKSLISEAKHTRSNGKTVYSFSFDLGPKMFNDEILVKVFTGDDTEQYLLDKEGNVTSADGFAYTAQEYIDSNLNNSAISEKLRALVVGLNDFGAYAQTYFKYNTENIAEIQGDISGIDVADLAAYAGKDDVKDESIIPVGSAMTLQDNLKLRLFFKLDGIEASELSFKVNGTKVEALQRDDMYYLETKNIPAKSFDKVYTFQILDKSGNVLYTGEYSAFSYLYSALSSIEDEAFQNLAKAMVAYNQAAQNYFSK